MRGERHIVRRSPWRGSYLTSGTARLYWPFDEWYVGDSQEFRSEYRTSGVIFGQGPDVEIIEQAGHLQRAIE